MNTAVRAIASRGLWVVPISLNRTHLFVFLLIIASLLSAFGLVYVKDMNRRLTSHWQQVQSQNVELHNQWTQLLLKKSQLANQLHVAKMAKNTYQMNVPAPRSVVIVRGES